MSLQDGHAPESVRRRPFTISKIFSSETTGSIKAKLHVEHPQEGGTKVNINDPGHMTKMATMPIYGKYINHNLGLTMTYFTARSILVT